MSRAFRYNLILVLVALGTSLAAVAGWRFARASAPVSGPIVLVSIDALRADHLPAYGYERVETPALDALAADGVVFERAYSHAPLTLPAHASLLSGRLPMDTGVRDNVATPIPDAVRLVSSMLADRGYATGGVVSSFALRRSTGIGQGFNFFQDDIEASAPVAPPGSPVVLRDGGESERDAERWLSATGTARAFLFLHLSEPHAPHAPPERFARFGAYDGEVAYADELVGRLVAYLKKQQLYDESTIIVVGDHGEGLGTHGERQHGLLLFDDTIRVPLIIKRAGSEGGGGRVPDLVQHVDIVPTILDLAKAPIPSGLAGRSLRPLFDRRALPQRMAYAESLFPNVHFGWPAVRTVTDGRYRYVSGPVPALFDLEADPESRHDVSSSHPEDVARLVRALGEFDTQSDPPMPPRWSDFPIEDRDRLLSLGHLGPRTVVGDVIPGDAPAAEDSVAFAEAYANAMRAVAEKRWTAAMDDLRMLARSRDGRPDVWASLGMVAERSERHDAAVEAYRHAVSAAPGAAEIRLRLASALVRTRRLDEARQHADEASRSEDAPVRVRAHELLARIALARRDPVSARVHAERVQEIDPMSPVPGFIVGRLQFDRARFDEAIGSFDDALEQAGVTPLVDLHLWRAEALMKLDRQAEAEDALRSELRAFPESGRAYQLLATLYHAQRRDDEVVALLARMTQHLRTPDAFETAARLWLSFGDRERAEAARAEAKRLLTAVVPPVTTQ